MALSERGCKNLLIEDKGKIAPKRSEDHEKQLRGAIELGVARRLLDWLPTLGSFPRDTDGICGHRSSVRYDRPAAAGS